MYGSGSWNRDDVIIYGKLTSNNLFRVPATGGTPEPLTQLDKTRGEGAHWAPWFLPDGRHFLYVALCSDPEKNAVFAGDLSSKTRKQVLGFGTRAIYVNPGYLLFVRDRTLMAQPFDAGKLELRGDAFPVGDQIDANEDLAGHFSASQNGLLAYTSSNATGEAQLTWFDRNGQKLSTVGASGNLQEFSLSRDDSAVVFTRLGQDGLSNLFRHDLVHHSESRLTTIGTNRFPVFSADSRYVFFASNHDGEFKVYRMATNGTGHDEVIDATPKRPGDASSEYLFTVRRTAEKNDDDIWVQPLSREGKPFAYVQTVFDELFPRISPDSSWLAYQSNESVSKGPEVYVVRVSFPHPDGKWPISVGGGRFPVWSRHGSELYYYGSDNKIWAVEIKPPKGNQFQWGNPKALFPVRLAKNVPFEVSNDGHFLVLASNEQEASAPMMTVVLNWPEMLKKK
jgi:Tol biopolymer transport system component